MESRIRKQKGQDSDRHSHYGTNDNLVTMDENGTNEERETRAIGIARKDDARESERESATNHRIDRATRITTRVTTRVTTRAAIEKEHAKADTASEENVYSSYPYFPLNYSVPTHIQQHFELSHYNNRYKGRYNYCPSAHYYPPHCYHSHHQRHPFPPHISAGYTKINSMAPFDDKTLVAGNMNKGKDGSNPLTVKTSQTKNGSRQRYDNFSRPPPPERSLPVIGHDCYRDPRISYHHNHYKFYDDSNEHGYDFGYHNYNDYSNYNSTAPTPQRSNQSAAVAERARRNSTYNVNSNQGRCSPMTLPPSRFETETLERNKKDAMPMDRPSHDQHQHQHQHPHFNLPPYYSNNEWYPEYGYQQPYPPQPYDRHYFCPSPPPPPPPHSFPEYSREACPSMDNAGYSPRSSSPPPPSWHEGRNDEYRQRRTHLPPSTSASYDDSYDPPLDSSAAQEFKDRPKTPSSCDNARRISEVTPQNTAGRKSPQTAKVSYIPSSTKAVVTPGVREKKAAAMFSPSSDVVELRDMDIVCGRGAPTNFHIGNDEFRRLASSYQTAYFCAKRSEKPNIAMKIMHELESRGARFVRRQKGGCATMATLEKNRQGSPALSSHWVEVSAKVAYEKVCQALRDGTQTIQRQMMSSSQRSLGNANGENQETRGGNSNIPQRHHPGEVGRDSIRTEAMQGKENGDTVHNESL